MSTTPLLDDVLALMELFVRLRGRQPEGIIMPLPMFRAVVVELSSLWRSVAVYAPYPGVEQATVSSCPVLGTEDVAITEMLAGDSAETYSTMIRLPKAPGSLCECGAERLNHPGHSDWCKMYKPHGYQYRP